MERSASRTCQGGSNPNGFDDPTPLPPWEQKNMARVPYMSRDARPLNEAEREALQSLWAANGEVKRSTSRPRIHGHGQQPLDNGYPLPRQDGETIPMPMSAPPFTAPRAAPSLPATMSRKSQIHTSAKSQHPSFTTLPPTPPPEASSLSRSSTTKSSSTRKSSLISSPGQSPRLPQHTVPSLPGTMSARESIAVIPSPQPPPSEPSSQRADRVREEKRNEMGKAKEKADVKPLGKRFKLAMKDIFKREPVDESQFERIADRHWTDE